MAGYSGTPLHRKLGLKPGMAAATIDAPPHYAELLGPDCPPVDWQEGLRAGAAFTHVFATERARLQEALTGILPVMARDGMVWVSWPKKSSGVASEITEDTVREVALPLGLVDVKVCAVDDTWSGLKLVIRKELR